MMLREALNSVVKQLMDIPSLEKELRSRGYTEAEILKKRKQIEPEASALLDNIKQLMSRLDNL